MINSLMPVVPMPATTTSGWVRYTEQQLRDYGRDCYMAGWHASPAENQASTGCLSNCDTCKYAWGSPANPGYCYMFYEEPQGVCMKHSEPDTAKPVSKPTTVPDVFAHIGEKK